MISEHDELTDASRHTLRDYLMVSAAISLIMGERPEIEIANSLDGMALSWRIPPEGESDQCVFYHSGRVSIEWWQMPDFDPSSFSKPDLRAAEAKPKQIIEWCQKHEMPWIDWGGPLMTRRTWGDIGRVEE